MIATSHFVRAWVFASCIYSFLIGLYVVVRVATMPGMAADNLAGPFVDMVPQVSFGMLALVSFSYCSISMAVYFYYWGVPRRPILRWRARGN
jgi:hypothetical protein